MSIRFCLRHAHLLLYHSKEECVANDIKCLEFGIGYFLSIYYSGASQDLTAAGVCGMLLRCV